MMKKTLTVAALVALTAGTALANWNGPTGTVPRTGVLNSVHDMRGYQGTTDVTVAGKDQQRVCAFCHTPHHAYDAATYGLDYAPLWSHKVNQSTFNSYQSTTLQINAANGGTGYESDVLVGPSRLCMSCHDGTIAVDTHYDNNANGFKLTSDAFNSPGVGAGPSGGGADLSNDHPIGFDYLNVAGATTTDTPGTNAANTGKDNFINPSTTAYKGNTYAGNLTIAQRLYTPSYAAGKGIMTCATCHDVHNRKNADDQTLGLTYLVLAPQKDSQLCLTCHIK